MAYFKNTIIQKEFRPIKPIIVELICAHQQYTIHERRGTDAVKGLKSNGTNIRLRNGENGACDWNKIINDCRPDQCSQQY